LRVWDLEDGKEILTLTIDGVVTACIVARYNRTIVAGDSLGNVHLLWLVEADKARASSAEIKIPLLLGVQQSTKPKGPPDVLPTNARSVFIIGKRSIQRTEWNIRDSDGTVLFSIDPTLLGDSKKTVEFRRAATPPVQRKIQHGQSSQDLVSHAAVRHRTDMLFDIKVIWESGSIWLASSSAFTCSAESARLKLARLSCS
jgi:hypothetical protein